MGVCIGDLEPRQIERLTVELAEALAVNFAYPPSFNFRESRALQRPIERHKRDEIVSYLSSASFAPVERADVTSPELRRFLERLLLRYLSVNPTLQSPRYARRLPELRARAPRVAAEIQRSLLAYLNGSNATFGARKPLRSWASAGRRVAGAPEADPQEVEHQTRVLESVLLHPEPSGPLSTSQPARPGSAPAARSPAASHLPGWTGASATIPVPSPTWTPESALARGPAPAANGAGPRATRDATPRPQSGALRELSNDLYEIYSDYLTDMQPEARVAAPPTAAAPAARPARAGDPGGAREDMQVFWQLRYQLEAYIRRAARSYGVLMQRDDTTTSLEALRQSGFVDEADLRIAEGILALTDRVTALGVASTDDYRQAFMLYLLYHRSHLA